MGLTTIGAIIIAIYVYRTRILPKPLPDIPFNKNAATHPLGDIPEMMSYVMRTKRIFCWLTSLTTRHQSAIVQAFIKPASLPWVVLTDPFESQDILLRRTKEFDRSSFFGELIGGILPEQHIQFQSADPRFKRPRNLINHLMAPTFITEVSAPEVYKSISTLIRLWKIKCEQAGDRPFSAHHDVTYAALDSIFASSFGLPEPESITIQQLKAVQDTLPKVSEDSAEAVFSEGDIPSPFSAILTLTSSVTDTQLSPAPVLTSWVLRKLPYMRRAIAVKEKYILDRIDEAIKLIEGGNTEPRSALHSVLLRERELAAKESRQPDYYKRSIFDEFFGFMMAGHDTSSTAVAWGVKYLADNPDCQDRLRKALRESLPQASRKKRAPTCQELLKAHIPYLDAVVEEILRHSGPIAFVVREALQDTVVLGRAIPKGTNVFLMANGPGYLQPNIPLPDENRNPGARRSQNKSLTGVWDDADIAEFRPERWLKEKTATENPTRDGSMVFDPMAGPTLAFGAGPRGCFGKRLGMQTLKIEFALIIWHFHLLPLPDELNSYEGIQRFAREPVQCYVRLKEVIQ
ncbi:cytochrome p450 [Colletotrichum sojae]|uniref:Cytochrome p450 n=1 Tax=Colletotrichum sojae TaxID=2175907 RepID=A0A8H6MPU7_9PEZI|nr:cytochrome p450 [Colletotrichum sojae]